MGRIIKKRNDSLLNFNGSFAPRTTVRIHTLYLKADQVEVGGIKWTGRHDRGLESLNLYLH